MDIVGTSSLFTEKYRPKNLKDYICSDQNRKLFQKVIASTEVPCFIFVGTGGTGKCLHGDEEIEIYVKKEDVSKIINLS